MPSRPFHALVLGGTGAVGRELVQILADDGARVAFTFHDNETLARSLCGNGGAVLSVAADLGGADTVTAAVRDACEQLDGIDALLHAAAICLSPGDLVRADD